MQDAAMFYTNRVLKDYKEKYVSVCDVKKLVQKQNGILLIFPSALLSYFFRDKTHVDWVNAYVSIWTELQAYIKQHHTTGLSWSKTVSLILVCSVCPTWFRI